MSTVGGAMAVVVLGVVALGVLTVVLLADFLTSESSTAGLLFLVLPFYQLLLVGATVVVAFVVHQRPSSLDVALR